LSHGQKLITCPRCGFQFDVLYARAVSCQGCSRMLTSLSCEYVKCPKCGFEFQISERAIKSVRAIKEWGSSGSFPF